LGKDSPPTHELCSKENQETNLDHVPFSNSIGLDRHSIQSTSDVRMAIIATNVVHTTSIDIVCLFNRFVPPLGAALHEVKLNGDLAIETAA